MKPVSVAEVRSALMEHFKDALAARSLAPENVPDKFDLLSEGVIDSLGIVEMIAALEQQLGVRIDFEKLDPEELTVVGPLCNFIATWSTNEGTNGNSTK
ncbi:MAG: acyl carrier protein [Candidatus Acidiferrales bacterium]